MGTHARTHALSDLLGLDRICVEDLTDRADELDEVLVEARDRAIVRREQEQEGQTALFPQEVPDVEEYARELPVGHALAGEIREYLALIAVLDELQDNGGDHQWRGNWYPGELISDSGFVAYAQELADDLGDKDQQVRWPYTCIDWEQAARELQQDYTSVTLKGEGWRKAGADRSTQEYVYWCR